MLEPTRRIPSLCGKTPTTASSISMTWFSQAPRTAAWTDVSSSRVTGPSKQCQRRTPYPAQQRPRSSNANTSHGRLFNINCEKTKKEQTLNKDMIPGQPWILDDRESAKNSLFREIDSAISWYITKKNRRRRLARMLRTTAILFSLVGISIPIIEPLVAQLDIRWGYLLFGFAGATILVDNTFGISTGWSRYVPAALELAELKRKLELEALKLDTLESTEESRWELLERGCELYWKIIQEETEQWLKDNTESTNDTKNTIKSWAIKS